MPGRYMPNDAEQLLQVPRPRSELIISLTRLVKGCSPKIPWTTPFKDRPIGLWTGPTSIAYVFLWLSRSHPDLVIEGHSPDQWCTKYLDCGSGDILNAQELNGWGVKNEYLAYNAVKAAATQDMAYVSKLCDAITSDFGCSAVDNEYLSGRAGTLALLRMVRHFVPAAADQVTACMPPLIKHILGEIPWRFHGHRYIGAAHGDIGILTQLVLSDHELGTNAIVEAQLNEQLDLQTSDGHWFITPDPKLGEDDLVHFCHGSPGFVLSLLAMRPFVRPELQARFDKAVELGRKEVWEKGLLRKEPNLCHGIPGNMLAFGEHKQREHFMAHATSGRIDEGIQAGEFIKGDDQSGLQWGEAGRAWGWMVIDTGINLGWPGYSDI